MTRRALPPLRSLLVWSIGTVLIFIGIGSLALTENALINYRLAADRHGGEVLDLGAGGAAAKDGSMVRVAGPLRVADPARDPEFGQAAATPVLVRHVEMFQWRQITIGGQNFYETDWVNHPVDWRRFSEPEGHVNPGWFAVRGHQFDAKDAGIGPFVLSPPLLHSLLVSATLDPQMSRLPPSLAVSFSRVGQYLVSSEFPDSPLLGDLRIHWEYVPLQTLTVVARLEGNHLLPAPRAADGQGFQIQIGQRSLLDIFPDLPVPPESTRLRRIVAFLLVLAGAAVAFRGRRRLRLDWLLPLGASALLAGAVASLMWLGTDDNTSLRWLFLALVGLALLAAQIAHRQLRTHPPTR